MQKVKVQNEKMFLYRGTKGSYIEVQELQRYKRFLYRQNEFLNPNLCRLLCNSIMRQHFDYACISWYSLVSEEIAKKILLTQNKCIRFCLKLNSRILMKSKKIKEINWLPTKEKVEQKVTINT